MKHTHVNKKGPTQWYRWGSASKVKYLSFILMLEQHNSLHSCHEFELWKMEGGLPNMDGNIKLLATESASVWSSAAVISKIWVINVLKPPDKFHNYCSCVCDCKVYCTVKCYTVLWLLHCKKAGSRERKVILSLCCVCFCDVTWKVTS